jgi:hypothetical protein
MFHGSNVILQCGKLSTKLIKKLRSSHCSSRGKSAHDCMNVNGCYVDDYSRDNRGRGKKFDGF